MGKTALSPVICLIGPTASGKTALAFALADRYPVHLISVDSAQIYRGMNIGTAKPDAATLARYPHALIDILDPEEPYSAGRFATDARRGRHSPLASIRHAPCYISVSPSAFK